MHSTELKKDGDTVMYQVLQVLLSSEFVLSSEF